VLSADERTNSVLLSGDKPTRLRLRTLIAHLDTPIEATGNTHVVYLRYAKAKELASVLTGVAEQATGLAAPRPGTPGGAAAGGRTDVNIQADERSNALVITGQLDVVESIKGVIRQLDIRRAQVLVEAIIAEVSPSRAAELGIQWQTDLGISTGAFGRFSTPSGSRLGSINEGEKPVESLRGGLALGYLEGGSLRVLLRAIAEDKSSNVLSTPNLVTMDNEEAEIIVGQNVPFVTGQYTSAATTPDNPFQTIQRQDVGIILKVKPQINEGDAVRLDIKQEVSSVIPGTTGSNLSTNKRSIDTKVMVDDGQVLVLGGLIEDKLSENIAKVPLLGDVPVLGALFRSRQLTSDKINLMVFLKPTILRTPADGTLVSSAKYSLLRAQQQAYQPQGVEIIPRLKREVLPPWPGDSTGAVPPESAAPAPEPEPTEASHEPFRFPWEDS
jgi:general secretion pathway protein D